VEWDIEQTDIVHVRHMSDGSVDNLLTITDSYTHGLRLKLICRRPRCCCSCCWQTSVITHHGYTTSKKFKLVFIFCVPFWSHLRRRNTL